MAVAKLDEGAATETDHEDVSRCAVEQQERHHLLGVRGDEDVGLLEPHRALDGSQVEVEVPRSGRVENERAADLSPAQPLGE